MNLVALMFQYGQMFLLLVNVIVGLSGVFKGTVRNRRTLAPISRGSKLIFCYGVIRMN